MTGYDMSERFIDVARRQPPLETGSLEWVIGDAEKLPFRPSSFDRVLLSLVLHQLARPQAAVREAFRVLRVGGLVIVRTIDPDDVAGRVPERYLPAMAEADAARLPAIDTVIGWLEQAGLTDVSVESHIRNKKLDLAEQVRELRTEARHRYTFIADEEVEAAIERMRADIPCGEWIDPRPTQVIVAMKPLTQS
jgi:ubiquinone/menaquinone biosynthesis C-methylase UbiE